jgi:hypothetical protein
MHAYMGGRYSEARAYFQRSYELSHRSGLLYNIATSAERAREDEIALHAYEQYLQDEPDTERRDQVDVRIRELRELIAHPHAATTQTISPVGPVLLGIGGAAVVAGVITGALALGDEGALTQQCGGDVCADTPENRAVLDRMFALATTTDVLLIGGGVLALTGLVLTFVLSEEHPVAATAACTNVGCFAQIGGHL